MKKFIQEWSYLIWLSITAGAYVFLCLIEYGWLGLLILPLTIILGLICSVMFVFGVSYAKYISKHKQLKGYRKYIKRFNGQEEHKKHEKHVHELIDLCEKQMKIIKATTGFTDKHLKPQAAILKRIKEEMGID